jgi:c(7)-type cytochrome triheme protein
MAVLPGSRLLLLGTFLVSFLSGGLLWRTRPAAQPVAFNHKKHVENGINCVDCHAGAQEQARATLPTLATCMTCHESALTQSPEEAKIRNVAAAGADLKWQQITRNPPNVYFSHRRHVRMAGLDCAECHGAMKDATAPPVRRFRRLDMNDCIHCHQQSNVKADCNDCHR